MISRELLRHLVIQQKSQIEKGGDFVERSILGRVLDAFGDNRVLILSGIRNPDILFTLGTSSGNSPRMLQLPTQLQRPARKKPACTSISP